MNSPAISTSRRYCRWWVLLPILLGGCIDVDDDKARAAINAVNTHFQACYEKTLRDNGTRIFKVAPEVALVAMGAALNELKMNIESVDDDLGYIYIKAVSPAPLPLDQNDWERAQKLDLPELRKLVSGFVGWKGNFITFEPEGLNIVLKITAVEVDEGTEMAVTMRFEETAPPRQGYPRRTYPPCEATRIGVAKIWQVFDSKLSYSSST